MYESTRLRMRLVPPVGIPDGLHSWVPEMVTVTLALLSSANPHEPNGVAPANSEDVYVADGSGSGAWKGQSLLLDLKLTDISSSFDRYVPIPVACKALHITTALSAAISGSDLVLTVKNAAGSSMGTITVTQSGSAAGDIDTLTPSSNNTFAANTALEIEGNGGPSSHVDLDVTILLERVTSY